MQGPRPVLVIHTVEVPMDVWGYETQNDLNVEFSHFYAEENFSPEHLEGALRYRQLSSGLKGRRRITGAVLIDDRASPGSTEASRQLILYAAQLGVTVDAIGYETRFAPAAAALIERLPHSTLSREHVRRSKSRCTIFRAGGLKIGLRREDSSGTTYGCALLGAAWTLCRLGILPLPPESVLRITERPFVANRAVTILPQRYEPVERKSLALISAAGFGRAISKIGHHYF